MLVKAAFYWCVFLVVMHPCFVGELYTWGKGRYGRLGHGDSDDQLKPKLVEALLGYRVIDVACGELCFRKCCIRFLVGPIEVHQLEAVVHCLLRLVYYNIAFDFTQ